MDSVFAQAKTRHVLPIIMAGIIVPYLLADSFTEVDLKTFDATVELILLELITYLMTLVLLWLCWCSRLKLSEVFGPFPSNADSIGLFSLGVPMVGVSIFLFLAVFYPLSYLAPEFTIWWAIEEAELMVPSDRPDAFTIIFGAVILAVLFAPVVEELIFRGFLFGRFREKYGMATSVVITSVLFALLHSDPLGSFLFAVIACLIRMRFDSLLAPILFHAGNNAFAVLLVAIDIFIFKTEYEYTLEELRSDWWLALTGGVVGLPWLYRYYRRELAHVRWKQQAV